MSEFPDTPWGHRQREKLAGLKNKQEAAGEAAPATKKKAKKKSKKKTG